MVHALTMDRGNLIPLLHTHYCGQWVERGRTVPLHATEASRGDHEVVSSQYLTCCQLTQNSQTTEAIFKKKNCKKLTRRNERKTLDSYDRDTYFAYSRPPTLN